MADLPQARLPSAPIGDKLQEAWADPRTLKLEAHALVVKPVTGRVLVVNRKGGLLGRFFDETTARAVLDDAGVSFDDLKAAAVQKKEQGPRAALFKRKTDSPLVRGGRKGREAVKERAVETSNES